MLTGLEQIRRQSSQRGVALIMALLVVALATTTAAVLTAQHQLSIRRSGNIINGNQAYQYALGAEALAISVLYQDRNDNETDGYQDIWAATTVPLPVQGGYVAGQLSDLQGRFNINNLLQNDKIDPVWVARFERLLEQFEINPAVSNAVVDWLDSDLQATGAAGAEDDYYSGLDIPYRAANGLISSVGELRLIRGLDVEQFNELAQHLTALPQKTALNINTASSQVLMSLGLDQSQAESLSREPDTEDADSNTIQPNEENAAFDSVAEFVTLAGQQDNANFAKDLATESNYFLFQGESRVDRGRAVLNSVLYRNNDGQVRVIMRSQGDI